MPLAESAWATGASLMASGLVPMTRQTFSRRSFPPTSAGANCLRSGGSQAARGGLAEIVGVGLELQSDGRRGQDMVLEPMLLAISDRGIFRGERHAHLRIGVAGTIPAGERIGAKRLLPFELEQPQAGVRLARLRRLSL
jgi:hypothetical protein